MFARTYLKISAGWYLCSNTIFTGTLHLYAQFRLLWTTIMSSLSIFIMTLKCYSQVRLPCIAYRHESRLIPPTSSFSKLSLLGFHTVSIARTHTCPISPHNTSVTSPPLTWPIIVSLDFIAAEHSCALHVPACKELFAARQTSFSIVQLVASNFIASNDL